MIHESNFRGAFLSHFKDTQTFGTSGIGTFLSKNFVKGRSECPVKFIQFGIDTYNNFMWFHSWNR
jgi:hypothetical protein